MPGFPALLAVVVLGLLAFEAGAQTPADENDPHPHHSEELLVLDPPANYLQHLPDLGLEILDVTDLPGIGSKLHHLRILDGAHPFEARDKHETGFAIFWSMHTIMSKIARQKSARGTHRGLRQTGRKHQVPAARGCVSESWITCSIKSIPPLRA